MNDSPAPLLEVRGLATHFTTDRGVVAAVNGVDLEVLANERDRGRGGRVRLRQVGDRAVDPGTGGRTRPGGGRLHPLPRRDLLGKTPEQMQRIRGNEIAMIFQEPMSSLNPVHTIGEQVIEALRIHRGLRKRQALARTLEMLRLVAFPRRSSACSTTRTSSPAACGNG